MTRPLARVLSRIALVAMVTLAVAPGRADPPAPVEAVLGPWLVEDGSAVIEVEACGETLCGLVYWSKDLETPSGADSRDTLNPDKSLRSRPICGLTIIKGLAREGAASWGGGTVYDPESGLTFNAEMRLEPNGRLRFRGYVAIPLLGGSQVWSRPAPVPSRCSTPATARYESVSN